MQAHVHKTNFSLQGAEPTPGKEFHKNALRCVLNLIMLLQSLQVAC